MHPGPTHNEGTTVKICRLPAGSEGPKAFSVSEGAYSRNMHQLKTVMSQVLAHDRNTTIILRTTFMFYLTLW